MDEVRQMKRNYYVEKSFILLTLTTLFIFLFSWGGAAAYEIAWPSEQRLAANTKIGGVDVGGLMESEAEEVLQEEKERWKNSSGLTLALFDEKVVLDAGAIKFDVTKSINIALENGSIPLQATIDQPAVADHLDRFSFTNLREHVSVSDLQNRLTTISDITESDFTQLDAAAYFNEEARLEKKTFNQVTVTMDGAAPTYLEKWTNQLDGYTIDPTTSFSLMNALEERDVSVFDDPSLDVLASAFYQVLAETNFVLTERHINEALPAYAEMGQDAHVDPNGKDLGFYNPNIYAYEWNLSVEGNQLKASLQGFPFLHDYSMITRAEETIEPRTIVRFDPTRSAGDRQTLTDGENGYVADVFREVRNQENTVMKETALAQDYYPPEHRLEEWSLQNRSDMADEISEQTWEEQNESADMQPSPSSPDKEDSSGETEDNRPEESMESENGVTEEDNESEDIEEDAPVKGYD
ncbi:VanW family protein [Salibacterium salarium]|nr:VanW family protein [Salibacterium salarium]